MRIRVTFSEMPDRFALGLNEQESFALKFDEGMLCHCVPYEGSYDIRPGLLAQTLPTNDRHLHEDILVRAIPYTEVSNITKRFPRSFSTASSSMNAIGRSITFGTRYWSISTPSSSA